MTTPFEFRTDVKFDVVGFGTNAIDHLVRVPAYPEFNSKIELSDYLTLPGGEVASTLVALQRLGYRTAYAGRFGDDEGGNIGLASLVAESVNVDHAQVAPGATTQVAFIIIDEQTGERTIIWKRDKKLAYRDDEAPLDLARSAKVLHMTAHDTVAAIKMAKAAREAGTIVSLDVDRPHKRIEELFSLTDILIASSDLLQQLTGTRDKLSAMTEAAARYGSKIVGMTLGSEGSYLLCDGVFIETPGFAVPGGCVDTTGAGDAFRGGLLYGLLAGMDTVGAARAANAVAALKCRGVGARTSLPTLPELQTMLKNF